MDNSETEREIIEHKVRRAVGLRALHKMSVIVGEERQADADKAKALRWFARYGWIILTGSALLLAYAFGLI